MEAQNEREQTLSVIMDYLWPFVKDDPILLGMILVNLEIWQESDEEI